MILKSDILQWLQHRQMTHQRTVIHNANCDQQVKDWCNGVQSSQWCLVIIKQVSNEFIMALSHPLVHIIWY